MNKEYSKEYYKNNKDDMDEYAREWKKKNRETWNKYQREYSKRKRLEKKQLELYANKEEKR
jgi:hypothetical protein